MSCISGECVWSGCESIDCPAGQICIANNLGVQCIRAELREIDMGTIEEDNSGEDIVNGGSSFLDESGRNTTEEDSQESVEAVASCEQSNKSDDPNLFWVLIILIIVFFSS